MSAPLSADVRIGRAALRVALDQAPPSDLQALLNTCGPRCRPDRFVAWCRYQGIVPSVHRVLAATDHPLAQRLHAHLAPHAQAIAGASLLQANALRAILEHLHTRGVDVLPLKGVGLDVRCYGGPGRRKDGDHDLLVRREQLPEAVRAVQDMGYRMAEDAPPPARWEADIAIHHGPPLVKHAGAMPSWIEFHWDVAPSTEGLALGDPAALTNALWNRSRADTLLGVPVRQMRAEDEVFYLCLHAIRHFSWHGAGLSVRLAMLEDIARCAAARGPIDWQAVAQRARSIPHTHLLGPIRYLWTQGLGASPGGLLPDAVVDGPWPRWWGRRILSARVLLGDASVPGWDGAPGRLHAEKSHRILMHSLLLRRVRDRVGLLWREGAGAFFQVNENDRQHVPDLVPDALVVPLRWVRLGRKVFRQQVLRQQKEPHE